ncbi:MAG TPA: histidine phosphatase family protein [Coxiellaceae bacterium]|nr:histidine phosphatase family protein [Coxiellaceae bacterium]
MRSPFYALKLFFLLNLLVFCNAYAEEKLIFAVDVIRHGDRTPIHEIPAVPYHWTQGLGQLTPTGMRQEYQLGSHLHALYIDQYHLLPPTYLPETMYVRSTNYDRTLMSAESFLIGLYPLGTGPTLPSSKTPALPQAYQPIPIHTVSQEQDTLLLVRTDLSQYAPLLKQHLYLTPQWKEKNAVLQSHYSEWSKATGVTITDLSQLQSLSDTLYINQRYHLPFPSGLSFKEAQTIIEAGQWVLMAPYQNKTLAHLSSDELLKTIVDYLQQAIDQKTSLKYVLFSAHDTTLLSLLGAMGAPSSQLPPYASDLNIMLFKEEARYYVKIHFNERPVLIPSCTKGICSIDQLKKQLLDL